MLFSTFLLIYGEIIRSKIGINIYNNNAYWWFMIQRENTSRKFLIFNLKIQFIFSLASAGPQGGALLKKCQLFWIYYKKRLCLRLNDTPNTFIGDATRLWKNFKYGEKKIYGEINHLDSFVARYQGGIKIRFNFDSFYYFFLSNILIIQVLHLREIKHYYYYYLHI